MTEYHSREGGSEEDRNEQWFRIIGELTGGKQPNDLTPAETTSLLPL